MSVKYLSAYMHCFTQFYLSMALVKITIFMVKCDLIAQSNNGMYVCVCIITLGHDYFVNSRNFGIFDPTEETVNKSCSNNIVLDDI